MHDTKRLITLHFLLISFACSDTPVDPGGGAPDGAPDHAPGDAATDTSSARGPSDAYIFDITRFHHFELEVRPEDWQFLKEHALLEHYVPATMIFEGTRYPDAAVRFKGAYNTLEKCFDDGEQVCPKLSIKVSFNEYGSGRFAGLRKLVFNSSVRDASMMRDVLGYRMFRQMGIWAPRASHAQVTVNGEWQGVFVLVEYIDKEFIQDRWEQDEGNLYKTVWPQYDTPDPYIETLRTNEDTADVSDMLMFKAILDSTSDATFAADMAGTLDLSYMSRFLAVDRGINNRDGSRVFYCFDDDDPSDCENNNYYWYHEPGALFHLLPWDLDYALSDENEDLGRSMWEDCDLDPVSELHDIHDTQVRLPESQDADTIPTQCDPLYGYVHRATWDEYLVALAELAAGPMSEAQVMPYLQAQREKIRDAVINDPFGPGPVKFFEKNDKLDDMLSDQRMEIEELLAEQLP